MSTVLAVAAGVTGAVGEAGATGPTSGDTVITRPDATVLCDPGTPREISLHWQTTAPGSPRPLFIFLRGGGGSFPNPYIPTIPGYDSLAGAFNLTMVFSCMNRSTFDVDDPSYTNDILNNPEDINHVYERLCVGNPPAGIPGVDLASIDCSRVALSGSSGGGISSLLMFNTCFSHLPVARELDAVATRYAGFTRIGSGNTAVCPAGSPYIFPRPTPLFMKAACADQLFPFDTVAPGWQRARPSKFLVEVPGGHDAFPTIGEPQVNGFFRYYFLGDAGGATVIQAGLANPALTRVLLAESTLGTRLTNGWCGGEFFPWPGAARGRPAGDEPPQD